MKLLSNLIGYNEDLDGINVSGTNYKTKKDFEPSIIMSQSFGETFDSDSYNSTLAKAVIDAETYFGEVPRILQSQVSRCYEKIGGKGHYSIGEEYSKDNYVSTEDIFNESLQIIQKDKIDNEKVLLIAHPAHVYRVIKTAEKYGLKGQPFITKNVDWPKKDTQWWVKGPGLWIPREILCRAFLNLTR